MDAERLRSGRWRLGWLSRTCFYRERSERAAQLGDELLRARTSCLANKYYVDEIYGFVIVKPLLALSRFLLDWVVDVAILGGLAWLLGGIAQLGRRDSAALAVGQSALVCGMAGGWRSGAAGVCAGAWSSLCASIGLHDGRDGETMT